MSVIIVTGCDGYCGWPTVLKLLEEVPECKVIGVDNMSRRKWVEEVESESAIPILSPFDREKRARKAWGKRRFVLETLDLTNPSKVRYLIRQYKPDVILHMAAQPSAPYSQIDLDHCNFTQNNNMQMLRNLCLVLDEYKLDTHLVVTTTTGIYGAPDFTIPEGGLVINEEEIPYPAMAGSWYHMSKAHDSGNLWLANKQFDFPITEMRTAIVAGSSTKETRIRPGLANRFDFDFYFGVVINRFVAMALTGEPISIYGKGLQRKPMISLEDMTRSMVQISKKELRNKERKYKVYNQVEKSMSIVELANLVKNSLEKKFGHIVEVNHIPNPRIEDEEHQMKILNGKFKKLINESFIYPIEDTIDQMCEDLYPYQDRFKNFGEKK